jgi:hypothetical protein
VHEDRSVKEDSGRGAIPLTHTFAIHQAAMGQVSVKQHEKSEMPYLDGWHGFHHDFIHHVRYRRYFRPEFWGLDLTYRGGLSLRAVGENEQVVQFYKALRSRSPIF